MEEILSRYLQTLKDERNYSENTTAAYRNDLAQFASFLKTYGPNGASPASIDSDLLQAYADFLKNNSYVSSTIARKVAAVKSFLRYLVRQGIIAEDPSHVLKSPRVSRQPPRILDQDSVDRLLAAPGEGKSSGALRDRALLELLYSTGLRVTEAVNLRAQDVDFESSVVLCRSRTGRQRQIPMGVAYRALSEYMESGRPALAKDPAQEALFLNHRGRGLTRQGLWLIIKGYAKLAGVGDDVTPYTLRHSFAKHLISGGADLQHVQGLLGHANLSTTQSYARVSQFDAESSQEPDPPA